VNEDRRQLTDMSIDEINSATLTIVPMVQDELPERGEHETYLTLAFELSEKATKHFGPNGVDVLALQLAALIVATARDSQ
jgi:hypothetical protein